MQKRTMKKRKMKKRKMKSLTLRELLSLHKIDLHIDWNYSVKATKTCDTRPAIQVEQEKLKTYGFTPLKII